MFGVRLGGRVDRDVKFWEIIKLRKKTKFHCFVFQKKSIHPLDILALIPCQVKVFLDVGIR